jgi:hypothetical protein
MEIIFTEFFFAYSLAECHKKVATIIFYFAAVSHATGQTDSLCFIYYTLPPSPLLTVQYFLSCGEANYTVSGHSKSWCENLDFGPSQKQFSERF